MNLCLEMIQVQLRLIRAIFKIKFEKTQVEQSRIPGAASGLFLTRSVITGEVRKNYYYSLSLLFGGGCKILLSFF